MSAEYECGTGSEPTDAHRDMVALVTRILLEVARRRQDELPCLVEIFQDQVLVTTGNTMRHVLGMFTEDAWRYGDRQVHELFVNADRRNRHPYVSAAEDMLVTLLHEACHVWAQANGIRDTSRGGRYHNRRFAEIALVIGLQVERDSVIGHRTPALSARGRTDYADLLHELDQGLVLAREPGSPRPDPDDEETGDRSDHPASEKTAAPAESKYVSASCRCPAGRGRKVTIRVARGSWRPEVIRCVECEGAFAES